MTKTDTLTRIICIGLDYNETDVKFLEPFNFFRLKLYFVLEISSQSSVYIFCWLLWLYYFCLI